MFAPLTNPDLAYDMFKLKENELLREAETNRLARQLVPWPRRQLGLMAKAGSLLVSLRTRGSERERTPPKLCRVLEPSREV